VSLGYLNLAPNVLGRSNHGGCDGRDVKHTWEVTNVNKIVAGEPEGKRPLDNNVKVDLKEIGCENMD